MQKGSSTSELPFRVEGLPLAQRLGRPGGVSLLKTSRFFSM